MFSSPSCVASMAFSSMGRISTLFNVDWNFSEVKASNLEMSSFLDRPNITLQFEKCLTVAEIQFIGFRVMAI